ncbi:MAG: hypothetical protein ACFE0Q_08740 [Anaerolineae bacterium]
MVDRTLQHFIYGNAVIANQATDIADILASSAEMTPDRAKQLIASVPISPLPIAQGNDSQAVAFVAVNGTQPKQYVMARAHYQGSTPPMPVHQLILIPDERAFDFDTLMTLITQPIPTYSVTHAPLEPLTVDDDATESPDKRVTVIKSLLDELVAGDFRLLLTLLASAIDGGVIVRNFPPDNRQRLALVRGLRLLLPAMTRALLTFTTYVDAPQATLPRITFSDAPELDARHEIDWDQMVPDDTLLAQPYIAHLLTSWQDDVISLVQVIDRCSEIATVMMRPEIALNTLLTLITQRHQQDLSALNGDALNSDVILHALDSEVPLTPALKSAYFKRLLEHNFETRDMAVARMIAEAIDQDSALDTDLAPVFTSAIEQQPDAVYAFVRNHLHHIENDIDKKWLTRLQNSAEASVKVALDSEDPETIRSWLMLISREPMRYQLGDILNQLVTTSQAYVGQSAELAQELLGVAVKRLPEIIDDLLADETLVAMLPTHVRRAVIEHDPDAIETLGSESRNLFLFGVYRAIEADIDAITANIVRILWQIHTQQNTATLPPEFRPRTLMERLVHQPTCFVNHAESALLAFAMTDDVADTTFFELVVPLTEQDGFPSILAQALEQSERNTNQILTILTRLLSEDILTPQTLVDTLSILLSNLNFAPDTLPLTEHLARIMTQYPDTDTSTGVLWKLSELSANTKNEQMLKVSMRRLLDSTAELLSEVQVVERILSIRKDASWSPTARAVLLKWWRQYAREQNIGQLQKIDKHLQNNRHLEEYRAVVQTSIAMRRIIGNRNLAEFSDIVATSYALLQALSEGFDSDEKLVDSITIRNEIDSRADELPFELRPVLSTNLKGLAQLVTTLSDNRSKPSIIRSDDTVERQLVKGEQQPQSAIDVMRWLSGYLDGVQKEEQD